MKETMTENGSVRTFAADPKMGGNPYGNGYGNSFGGISMELRSSA